MTTGTTRKSKAFTMYVWEDDGQWMLGNRDAADEIIKEQLAATDSPFTIRIPMPVRCWETDDPHFIEIVAGGKRMSVALTAGAKR